VPVSDRDRFAGAFAQCLDGQLTVGKGYAHWVAADLDGERKALEPVGQPGCEGQGVAADVGAGVDALDEIERPRHYAHVDAFLGGAALNVADVAFQRDQETLPGRVRVDVGQHGGVHDEAECGPV